jgi:hypothetical protein
MLTVEEQQYHSKVTMRLERITDSLESIAKSLAIISQIQMDKNLDMKDYYSDREAEISNAFNND